ncbi:hypothetical protein DPMN_158913 [Dreissena polymorpha]|uniref:Uncharacterized protein n=1 Tax=Dreissena polymorpha TaxID=45954 RepID=A0A9D4EK12_DREPO|nr:hypothetical protein DPMN_158913 [Dreissena polymorpha]
MSYKGQWMCYIQDVPSRSNSQGVWDKISCPARSCRSKACLSWVCGHDGNSVYINEHGKIKCAHSEKSEGIHIADVCQSGWTCGDSSHKDEYIKSDFDSFVFTVSDALKFSSKQSSSWIFTLTSSLGRQFGV